MNMIQICPILVTQVDAARQVILNEARNIFNWQESIDEIYCMYSNNGVLSDLDDIQKSYFERKGIFLVALDGDVVIGTGGIREWNQDYAELKRLWLLNKYQGKGIGYALTQRLLEFARKQDFQLVRLETSPKQIRAIKFYTKLGFRQVGKEKINDNDILFEMEL